jgi:hypothetical protein
MHPPIGITLCLLVRQFTNLKNFVYKFLLDFYKTLDITCYLFYMDCKVSLCFICFDRLVNDSIITLFQARRSIAV